MKKNDFAVLALIVTISLLIAYFAGQALISRTKPASTAVESVDKIDASITPPDAAVFNKDAINPSVPIRIGDSSNQQPFGQ